MKTKVIILGLASLLVLCFTRISWAAAENRPDPSLRIFFTGIDL